MSDTLEGLRHKIESARDLESVVGAMRAVAAASVGQYEKAVQALGYYFNAVEQGLSVCLKSRESALSEKRIGATAEEAAADLIVFGSDQGLVGSFNEQILDRVREFLESRREPVNVWVVGERIQSGLLDSGLVMTLFRVPYSVEEITELIRQLLDAMGAPDKRDWSRPVYVIHCRPEAGSLFIPLQRRLIPLDREWADELIRRPWNSERIPEVIGETERTLSALVGEYLFICLYKACAESLASENLSRLAAMQRAKKSIGEQLEMLQREYQHLRQALVDEELFEVLAGSEAQAENGPVG